MTTRMAWLAGLVSASALLAACGTTAPEQSASLAQAPGAEQEAVVTQAVGTGQAIAERRVAVNAPKSTAISEAEASNRVIVSAARNAKRTGNLEPYIKALSDASCPAGTAVRAADAISITAMPTALQPSDYLIVNAVFFEAQVRVSQLARIPDRFSQHGVKLALWDSSAGFKSITASHTS